MAQITTDDLLDVLTLGEIAQVEELSGTSISLMQDPATPKARLIIAMACIANRRNDPSFTMNQAETLTGKGLNEILESIVVPTDPADPDAPVNPGTPSEVRDPEA